MKTTRHATYELNYHIVWIPTYRRSVRAGDVAIRVRNILQEIADVNGAINIADRYLSGESRSREHENDDDSAEDGARLTAPQDSQADATLQETLGTHAS